MNAFDKEACTPLEEWLDYLKNGRIRDDTTTPGLAEARAKLQYMMMSKEEKVRYLRHVDLMTSQRGAMRYYHEERLDEGLKKSLEKGLKKGRVEGKAEGLAEGEAKGRAESEAKGEAKA